MEFCIYQNFSANWYYYCMLDVSWTASNEITLVHLFLNLPVHPSVHRSLSVLKICSLVFSDIVHDGRRPWYFMTDAVRFWKRKNWQLDFGPNGLKLDLKLGFLPFSQIWFIGFPYNCIHKALSNVYYIVEVKSTQKKFWASNLGQRDQNWN